MNKLYEWFQGENKNSPDILENKSLELYKNTYGNPIFSTPYGNRYMINADATASGFFYKPIETFIQNNVIPYYNNTHSNAFAGQMMNLFISKSKEKISKSINANKNDKILFTGNGCTGAIQHIIHMLNLRKNTEDKPVIFISEAEHHSNDLPWRHLPIDLVILPIDMNTGLINLSKLKKYLKKFKDTKLKLISVIAVSNITGVVQPIEDICMLGHKYGALVMFDYATGGPYIPINMHKDEASGNYIDIIVTSTHKFLGGPNTPGLLIVRESCCRNNIPFCPGGGTVRFVTDEMQKYSDDIETRENGGTPNIVGCIKSGLCFELKDKLQSYINNRELWLVRYVQAKLINISKKNKVLEIINPLDNADRIPIFAFRVKNVHYNLIVALLSDLFGIQSRGGISCCSMYAQRLLDISETKKKDVYKSIIEEKGVPSYYGWCRITFHYTMPKYIVDYIIQAVDFVVENVNTLKTYYVYDSNRNNWYYSDINSPKTRAALLESLVDSTIGDSNIVYPTIAQFKEVNTLNKKVLDNITK
jgi:selenocysteine lyase/cysteine desulfurase